MFPENHRNFFSYLFFHLAEILEITWFAWYIIIWAAHKQLTNQKRCSHCPMLHLYMEALWIWILQKSCALWEVPKDMPVPLLSCFTLQDNSHQNSHEMVLLHVPFLPALSLPDDNRRPKHTLPVMISVITEVLRHWDFLYLESLASSRPVLLNCMHIRLTHEVKKKTFLQAYSRCT